MAAEDQQPSAEDTSVQVEEFLDPLPGQPESVTFGEHEQAIEAKLQTEIPAQAGEIQPELSVKPKGQDFAFGEVSGTQLASTPKISIAEPAKKPPPVAVPAQIVPKKKSGGFLCCFSPQAVE